jgi:hypothetical protein
MCLKVMINKEISKQVKIKQVWRYVKSFEEPCKISGDIA